MNTRVVIADDQPVVLAGYAAMLDAQLDITVVGQAANGAELVALIGEVRPDVAVVDVRMPEMDGLEAIRRVRDSGAPTRMLMVTTFDLDEYVYDALKAGASGFLLKDAPIQTLVEAVRLIADGSMLLGPSVTRRLIEQVSSKRNPARGECFDMLTATEREICVQIARGLSNREIALERSVGEQTVKSHVSEVLRKLQARDRVQVVVAAYESGLVEPGQSTPGS